MSPSATPEAPEADAATGGGAAVVTGSPRRHSWRALLTPTLALWVFRLAAAWWAVGPLVVQAEGLGLGHQPGADAGLFADGGWLLAEAARLGRGALGPGAARVTLGLALAAWLALLPFGALLTALAAPGRLDWPALGRGALLRFVPLSKLAVLAALARAVAVLVVLGFAVPTRRWFETRPDERWADLATLGWLIVALALHAAISVLHDLARVALVPAGTPGGVPAAEGTSRDTHGIGWGAALAQAARTFSAARSALLVAWGARALVGVALASAVVAVTPVLDVSRTEGWRVWALTTLHAGTLLGLVLLRVSWLRLAAARVLTAPRA